MQHPESFPISKIKIRVPYRRRELIRRTDLIELLYDQLEKRLLLIIAPAGYGKTSLLVDLAQDSDLPVCWFSLDELDQEPQRFLSYLVAAISERFPKFGKDSMAALESMTSFEQDGERVIVALSNEIATEVNEHFILILDDYHLVGDILIIRQLINRFLQLVGENVHLILAARHIPDFPDMPLLTVRNQIGGLSFEELAFKTDEIQKLFLQNEGKMLTIQDANSLIKETEGWIAAIRLSGGHPGFLPQMHPLRSTRELFDFFLREVYAHQARYVQRFLLLTSVFDAFNIDLCVEIIDPLIDEQLNWTDLFNTVQSENIFSILLDEEGRWMRYHHLFQHFLRSKLQYDEPTLAWHIQQGLARAYEEQQAWEEALQVYEDLDDYENLARVLVRSGPTFLRRGRTLTLASWLEKLSKELVYTKPALISLLGIVLSYKGELQHAIELFNLAENKLHEVDDTVELAMVLTRRAEAYRQLGHYDLALNDTERTLKLTEGLEDLNLRISSAEAQRLKGLSLFGLGQLKEALSWLKNSLHSYQDLGILESIPILETELGVVHRRLGEPEIAMMYYTRALDAWEDAGNTGWKARLLNNLALLYQMTGRLDKAFPLLEKALQTAERSGYARIQTNILISLGDLLTDLDDLEAASDSYEKALTSATNLGDSLLIFYASLGEARINNLRGNFLQALEDYKRVEVTQIKIGRYERALLNIEKGSCLVKLNRLNQASQFLRDAVELLDQGINQMEQASARLWLVISLYEQDTGIAMEELKSLLPPSNEWQRPTPLMITAGRVEVWMRKSGRFNLDNHIVNSFFQQAQNIYDDLPALREKLSKSSNRILQNLRHLNIVTFGPVEVTENDRVLKISDWQTREARDLFLFLLQSPHLTKEQIALEFWPEISPSRLKMRFKINIYRIRRALGQDVVIFEDNHYRFNTSIRYSWDREKFDALQKAAESASEKAELLEQALILAKGPYLADVEADWAASERLKYQKFCQQIMLELADIYLNRQQIEECLRIAERSLELDPLLEAAHRLIIQAYAALHDPANMSRQYFEYQKSLLEEMGLHPSIEMRTLYEQLLRTI